MPTYQYSCTECGHFLEQFQAFTDDALTECPVCGGRLRKVFNAVGVVFKGSGFYRNDSRSGGNGESSGKGADSSTTKDSAGAGKSGSGESGSKGSKESGTTGSGSTGSGSASKDSGSSASSTSKGSAGTSS